MAAGLEATRRNLAAQDAAGSPPGRVTSTKPAFCGICGRRATPFAAHPEPGKLVLWVCNDPNCWSKAVQVAGMTNKAWLLCEKDAAARVMAAGGAAHMACKTAGVYDFKLMTPGQRLDFALAVLDGYRAAIIEVLDETPW
jgi:hypothetical protein